MAALQNWCSLFLGTYPIMHCAPSGSAKLLMLVFHFFTGHTLFLQVRKIHDWVVFGNLLQWCILLVNFLGWGIFIFSTSCFNALTRRLRHISLFLQHNSTLNVVFIHSCQNWVIWIHLSREQKRLNTPGVPLLGLAKSIYYYWLKESSLEKKVPPHQISWSFEESNYFRKKLMLYMLMWYMGKELTSPPCWSCNFLRVTMYI